ncbi:hypothetical protein E8E13_000403 [Curvularia kusanoi]|uniref:Uncharacterized protein n=1 Tax=Curvularia kusanoi TaxID=90978 RepID=A0A9P4T460_CURKU|nr:hypothetical protein E8E13_000403 [Curvularia kusanoi]
MANPNRGSWGPGGQPGGGVNQLKAAANGTANSTHQQAFTDLTKYAHQQLIRTHPGSVIPSTINRPQGFFNFAYLYTICAVRSEKPFTAFLGCVSISGEWNGACSNCVWSDAGARCIFAGSRPAATTGPSRAPNARPGPSGGSAVGSSSRPAVGPSRSGRRAIGAPDESEERIVDLSK